MRRCSPEEARGAPCVGGRAPSRRVRKVSPPGSGPAARRASVNRRPRHCVPRATVHRRAAPSAAFEADDCPLRRPVPAAAACWSRLVACDAVDVSAVVTQPCLMPLAAAARTRRRARAQAKAGAVAFGIAVRRRRRSLAYHTARPRRGPPRRDQQTQSRPPLTPEPPAPSGEPEIEVVGSRARDRRRADDHAIAAARAPSPETDRHAKSSADQRRKPGF